MKNYLTISEFMKYYDDTLSDEDHNYILWNMTAYPFGNVKLIVKQIRSAIRILKNGIEVCEICGMKRPYHKYCLEEGI